MLKAILQSVGLLQPSQNIQSSGGLCSYGIGVSYTQGMTGIGSSAAPSDNEVRLALQGVADEGGSASSFPSSVSAGILHAARCGWLDDGMKEMLETSANGQCSANGFTTYKITESGRKKLEELTAACPNPTRLVHQQRYIPGAGIVAYGAPTEQPINRPFSITDGCIVAPYL